MYAPVLVACSLIFLEATVDGSECSDAFGDPRSHKITMVFDFSKMLCCLFLNGCLCLWEMRGDKSTFAEESALLEELLAYEGHCADVSDCWPLLCRFLRAWGLGG